MESSKGELRLRTSKHGTPTQRRGRIIDAGTRSFAQRGFYDATFEDIIRESGLSRGTLYWHFSSKDDLYDAVVAASISQVEGWLSDGPGALATDGSYITGLFETLVEDVDRNEDAYRLLYLAARPPRAEAELQRLDEVFLRFLRALVRAAIGAGELDSRVEQMLPDLIFALVEGMILRRLSDPAFPAVEFALHAGHLVKLASPPMSGRPTATEHKEIN